MAIESRSRSRTPVWMGGLNCRVSLRRRDQFRLYPIRQTWAWPCSNQTAPSECFPRNIDSILIAVRSHIDSHEVQNVNRPMSSTQHPGYPLRRYYWRAFVGCCGPLLITTYYLLTWFVYLSPPESPNETNFGRAGAQFVLYSWFLLGVFGLDLGEYGLIGIEGSTLMTTLWSAPTAWHIMMHGEHSWTGIGGWMSTAKSMIVHPRPMAKPTMLWSVLATLSVFLFVGLPLTGLTMEVRNGFQLSNYSLKSSASSGKHSMTGPVLRQ